MKGSTAPRQQPVASPNANSAAVPTTGNQASRSPTPVARSSPSGPKSPGPAKQPAAPAAAGKQPPPPPAPGGTTAQKPSLPPAAKGAPSRAPSPGPAPKGPPSRSPSPATAAEKSTPPSAARKTPPAGGGAPAAGAGVKTPPLPAPSSKQPSSSGPPPVASGGPRPATSASPSGTSSSPPRAATPKGAAQPPRPPIPPIAKKSPDRSAGPKTEGGGGAAAGPTAPSPTTAQSKSPRVPPVAISPKKVPPPPGEPSQQQPPQLPQKTSPAPAKAKKSPARPPANKKTPVPATASASLPTTATATAPAAEVRPPTAALGIAPRPGDFGPPPPTETGGTLCARLIVASDKDVIDDWKERNIHGDVPFNVPVKDVIERLLLLRLKWDAGLEGLVPVESRGTDFVSLIPIPELVMPVALTPKELGWEPGHTYVVWLQRSGKLDAPVKSRGQLYKERLRAFYQYYAPDKEKEVDAILTDFDGSEELLFAKLAAMYGPEPTEQQLRRRRFQLNNAGIPATAMLQQPSDIGLTIREMQEQHLKDSGRFDTNRDELNYHPNRPSEVARYGLSDRYPVHPAAASSASMRGTSRGGDGSGGANPSASIFDDVHDGGGDGTSLSTAPGLIRHALTTVMTRMNGALLLALYYKRWLLWRNQRAQKRRICAYLRGSFDVVLRREYYLKWRAFLGSRKMRRQVQQSTQLAAKSEGLVGDLATENSVLKGELKRLRTQVEMLDNNNAKRLETLYNSSELAIGQIRTLTTENNQKEELIQQLEQRLMHVGNLMLQASDAKEHVLEATAAEKLQLSTDNERLQAKVTLLEDALEAANAQLEAWKPKPITASCLHCEHYFDLQREVELLHQNSDVLRARIQDVEAEKNTMRCTMNTLAQQLREQRHVNADSRARQADGGAPRQGRHVAAHRVRRRSSGDGEEHGNSPRQHPQDYFNASSTSDDGRGSPPPPPPPDGDDSDDGNSQRSLPSHDDGGIGVGESPTRSYSSVSFRDPTASGQSFPNRNARRPSPTSPGAPPPPPVDDADGDDHAYQQRGQPLGASVARSHRQEYRLPPAIGQKSHSPQHHHRVPEHGGPVRTLAESFASFQRLPLGDDRQEEQTMVRGGREWPMGRSAGAVERFPGNDRPPTTGGDQASVHRYDGGVQRSGGSSDAAGVGGDAPVAPRTGVSVAPPTATSAALSLDGFFRSEEQRFDERLRMSMDRQLHNRLRTSGFTLQHGTIQRDTEARGLAAQHRVLQPTQVDHAQLPQPQSVFALHGAAEAASRGPGGPPERHNAARGGGVGGTFGYRTSAEDIANSRQAASEAYLLHGAAPHERPKSLPERHGVETQVRGVPGIEHDVAAMRRSIFAYSGKR